MGTKRFAPGPLSVRAAVLLVLAALLAACAPIPGLPAPTGEPVTATATAAPAASVVPAGGAPVAGGLPVTPTLAMTATPASAGAATGAPAGETTTPEPAASPVVTAAATIAKPLEGGPAPALSTYRDDAAGFEIDYPAAWSVVDVTPGIKQQSAGYSITFMSWTPQEPGGQGIPEGGSKIDVGVARGAAASPEAAVATRRQEIAQADPAARITFEEPWELTGGLAGTRWTIQPAGGETVNELVTAIGGNLIVVSGYGEAALFEQIAMTLRPVGAAATAPAAGSETTAV